MSNSAVEIFCVCQINKVLTTTLTKVNPVIVTNESEATRLQGLLGLQSVQPSKQRGSTFGRNKLKTGYFTA